MAATGHKPVVHTVGWRGRIKTAQVESEQATSQFVCWARAGQSGSRDAALSSSARMLLLCLLKGGNLITAVVQPHGKDDPGPHIRQSAYRHRVTFAFCPFSLVIGLGPRLTLRRLPSKLMQGVAQGLDTRQTTVCLGVRPALEEHRRGPSQRLQTAGIPIARTLIANFSQESGSQALACPWQALKQLMVLMGQKKGVNLLVILSNLLDQWQELVHQNQHQARFGAGRHRIGLQMRLMHALHDLLGNATGVRMSRLTQDLPDLLCRSVHRRLWGGVGVQEQQSAPLVQFPKQLQSHWVIGFETGRQLIDQTGLHLDQAVLVAGQGFELRYLLTVRDEPVQIRQVGSSSFGKQIRINCIRFGTRGGSAAIDGARIDWVDWPALLQQMSNQQTMGGLDDTGHLFFRRGSNDLLQKRIQFAESRLGVTDPKRASLVTFFINHQDIMMIVSPVNPALPHETDSFPYVIEPSQTCPYTRRSKRDSLMIGLAQEERKTKGELFESVKPGGGSSLLPSVFTWFIEQVYSCSGPVSRACS